MPTRPPVVEGTELGATPELADTEIASQLKDVTKGSSIAHHCRALGEQEHKYFYPVDEDAERRETEQMLYRKLMHVRKQLCHNMSGENNR